MAPVFFWTRISARKQGLNCWRHIDLSFLGALFLSTKQPGGEWNFEGRNCLNLLLSRWCGKPSGRESRAAEEVGGKSPENRKWHWKFPCPEAWAWREGNLDMGHRGCSRIPGHVLKWIYVYVLHRHIMAFCRHIIWLFYGKDIRQHKFG